MAIPIGASSISDTRPLSIDDLLESETLRLGGPGPFVINLSASSAPLGQPPKEFTELVGVPVYQIQRLEDRRPRYRLRLGPFTTELEADAMLSIVRGAYPGALTATADADDLRALAPLTSKTAEAAPPAAPSLAVPPSAAPPTIRPSAAPIPVLSQSIRPVAASAAARTTAPSIPSAAPSKAAAPARRVEARELAPTIESTQTLRALTTSELGESAGRWYVIQLSLSKEPFDPDSLPNLDIFNEYRLYSVAGLDQGHIVHALRLGFFSEEGAAAAVAGYLGTYYEKPTVKRISVAERERFRDQRVEARKDIGATGRHAVIEITGEMHLRQKRAQIASVTPLTPAAALDQSTAARKGTS